MWFGEIQDMVADMNPTISTDFENDRRTIQLRMVQLIAEAYELGTAIANDLPNGGLYPLMEEVLAELGRLRRSTADPMSLEAVTYYMMIYLSEAIDSGVADARGRCGPPLASLLEKTRTLLEGH